MALEERRLYLSSLLPSDRITALLGCQAYWDKPEKKSLVTLLNAVVSVYLLSQFRERNIWYSLLSRQSPKHFFFEKSFLLKPVQSSAHPRCVTSQWRDLIVPSIYSIPFPRPNTRRLEARHQRGTMGNFPSRSWRLCVPFSLHFVAFAFLWWKHRQALKAGNLIFEKIGHVAGTIFYPVKSCRGISLKTANCLIEGLEDDRLVNIIF